MKSDTSQHRRMYRVFAVLTAIFIVLLVLAVRQGRRQGTERMSVQIPSPPPPAPAALSAEGLEWTISLDNLREEEARNLAGRPVRIPGDLDIPTEARQALKMQTRTLLDELRDQPPAGPGAQRALAIPEEEIRQLEKEGRMIF